MVSKTAVVKLPNVNGTQQYSQNVRATVKKCKKPKDHATQHVLVG
jgi:hypothetical protein